MIIYFHIDEVARDAIVASALAKEIKEFGGKVVYGNRFITSHVLRHFNVFDVIILPSLHHYINAFPDAKALPKNIFILQTEAVGQATGTLRRLNAKYFGNNPEESIPWHESVAGYFLWGHSHVNPFREHHPSYLEKTYIVGHPRLSDSCRSNKKIIKSDNKPVVGFVSRFNLLNPYDSRSQLESIVDGMRYGKGDIPKFENSPDRDIEDLYYTEVIDFRVLVEIMISLDQNKYSIAVRPHPRENRYSWISLVDRLNLNITVSEWDEPFGHWLQKLDYIVTPPSTSLYDIYYYGKKAIVTSNIVGSRASHVLTESDDNNQILEGVPKPESVADVVSMIESDKITYDKNIINDRLYEQVAADIASNSIVNILNVLFKLNLCGSNRKNKIMMLYVFLSVSLFLSYIRFIKSVVQRRKEQGSEFHLTGNRIKWINRLTQYS